MIGGGLPYFWCMDFWMKTVLCVWITALAVAGQGQDTTLVSVPMLTNTVQKNMLVTGSSVNGVPVVYLRTESNPLAAPFLVEIVDSMPLFHLFDTVDVLLLEQCNLKVQKSGKPSTTYHYYTAQLSNHRPNTLPQSLELELTKQQKHQTTYTASAQGKIVPFPYSSKLHIAGTARPYIFVSGNHYQDTIAIHFDSYTHPTKDSVLSQLVAFNDLVSIENAMLIHREFESPFLKMHKDSKLRLVEQTVNYSPFQRAMPGNGIVFPRSVLMPHWDTLLSEQLVVVELNPGTSYGYKNYRVQSLSNGVSWIVYDKSATDGIAVGSVVQVRLSNSTYKELGAPFTFVLADVVPLGTSVSVQEKHMLLDTLRVPLHNYHQQMVWSESAIVHRYDASNNSLVLRVAGHLLAVQFLSNPSIPQRLDVGSTVGFTGVLFHPGSYSAPAPMVLQMHADSLQKVSPLFTEHAEIEKWIDGTAIPNFQEKDFLLDFGQFSATFYNYGVESMRDVQRQQVVGPSDTLYEEVFNNIDERIVRIHSKKRSDTYKMYYKLNEAVYLLKPKEDQNRTVFLSDNAFTELPQKYWNAFQLPKRKNWQHADLTHLTLGDTAVDSGGEMGFIATLVYEGQVAHYGLQSITLKFVRSNGSGAVVEEREITIWLSYGC